MKLSKGKIHFISTFILSFIIIILIIMFYTTTVSSLEKLVVEQLQNDKLRIDSQLSIWIESIGEPKTIAQIDSGHTFFYWSDRGIAVFCHPLYHQQYKKEQQINWIVTSIFIPVQRIVRSNYPPLSSTSTLEFTKLILPTKLKVNEEVGRNSQSIIFHCNEGELQMVEIRKRDSIFGDYD